MNGLGENAGCEGKQVQPIEVARNILHKELDILSNTVTTLNERLSPVMTSPAAKQEAGELKGTSAPPERSEMLASLQEAVCVIKAQRSRLSGILTRMQL